MESSPEMELRKFVAPEFIFGSGARNLAPRYAHNYGARKILVVSDPGVVSAGWVEPLLRDLKAEDLPFELFTTIHSNPRDEEVMAGAEVYLREHCNLIIAIGGGSPMDCAKGIGIVSANRRSILEFEGVDEVAIPGPPLICIPTTAGSSADVSQFAIITDTTRLVKIAIITKMVVPDVALIDPATTATMDPYLTACTGLDALTHAFEAYASNAHSPVTHLHALEAIRLIWQNLSQAIAHPNGAEPRQQMMLASMYAGLAFSNASLGAVHAMAHSLGGFLDLPHGECNALLLEHVIAYNFPAAPEAYRAISRAIGLDLDDLSLDSQKNQLVGALARFRVSVGIDKSLGVIGVRPADIPSLAAKAIKDPCIVTNPRDLDVKDIETIFANAL